MNKAHLSDDGRTPDLRVSIEVRKQGGQKVVIAPDGTATPKTPSKPNGAPVKALARAFRWRKLIETGVCGTIAELSAGERVNPSYVSRILRLTLLAPDIVESILDDQASITTTSALSRAPKEWRQQRLLLRRCSVGRRLHRVSPTD